jgi:hypothetical protein
MEAGSIGSGYRFGRESGAGISHFVRFRSLQSIALEPILIWGGGAIGGTLAA